MVPYWLSIKERVAGWHVADITCCCAQDFCREKEVSGVVTEDLVNSYLRTQYTENGGKAVVSRAQAALRALHNAQKRILLDVPEFEISKNRQVQAFVKCRNKELTRKRKR